MDGEVTLPWQRAAYSIPRRLPHATGGAVLRKTRGAELFVDFDEMARPYACSVRRCGAVQRNAVALIEKRKGRTSDLCVEALVFRGPHMHGLRKSSSTQTTCALGPAGGVVFARDV